MDLASLSPVEARTHLLARAAQPSEWMQQWDRRGERSELRDSAEPMTNLSADLSSLLGEGRRLRDKGNTMEAAAVLQDAIQKMIERTSGPESLGEAHAQLGVVWHEAGLWEGAVSEYMRAIDFYQKAGSEGNAKVLVRLYNNLAMVCRELGRTDEAELAYVTAIEFHDAYIGAAGPESLATIYENLAYLYQEMGLADAAYDLERLAMEVYKKYLPEDKLGALHTLRRAGIFAATGGNAVAALKCFEQARRDLGGIPSVPESVHVELLINEATCSVSLGLADDALALYERAAVALHGKSDPLLLALVANNVGCILLGQKKFPEAVAALVDAHDLQRNHPAADQSARAEALHNLALAYDGLSNTSAAAACRSASRQLLEWVSEDVRLKLTDAHVAREAVASSSIHREVNPRERAYMRMPALVPVLKQAKPLETPIPLRTETIQWM
jgi:tetratricopeptide (TPR) repeat protein